MSELSVPSTSAMMASRSSFSSQSSSSLSDDLSIVALAVDASLYNGLLFLLMGLLGLAIAAEWARSVRGRMQARRLVRNNVNAPSSPSPSAGVGGTTAVSSSSSSTAAAALTNPLYRDFKAFQRNFLFTFILMATADWLQGAYVYRLYSYYGFSRHENGVLFIAGYGSSLFIGTWVGPIADRYGRKLACILYGVTYMISCVTKFYNHFGMLMLGRIVSGVATSILCSGFESWMASEHQSRGYDSHWIGETFSLMSTLNGLAAIGSGFLAEFSVYLLGNGHPVTPFGLAGVLLLIGTVLIAFQWRENYGCQATASPIAIPVPVSSSSPPPVNSEQADSSTSTVITSPVIVTESATATSVSSSSSSLSSFFGFIRNVSVPLYHAAILVLTDKRIRLVGLVQSLFEGCMYTFVFMWSPALEMAARTTATALLPLVVRKGDSANERGGRGPSSSSSSPPPSSIVVLLSPQHEALIASLIPYGIIFATFMLGSSLGGMLYGYILDAMKKKGGSGGGSGGESGSSKGTHNNGEDVTVINGGGGAVLADHHNGSLSRQQQQQQQQLLQAQPVAEQHSAEEIAESLRTIRLFKVLFFISASCFAVVSIYSSPRPSSSLTHSTNSNSAAASAATIAQATAVDSQLILMVAFVVFEVCVGMFWPMLGVLRTLYLPEDKKATIINIFRIPLNAIVIAVLWFQGSMGVEEVFGVCCLLLLCGIGASVTLEREAVVALKRAAAVGGGGSGCVVTTSTLGGAGGLVVDPLAVKVQ